jgi:two-component system NarL family sensor kinase
MNLKLKILLLATLPLIFAIGAILLLVSHQASELFRQEVVAFEETMLKAKKAELLNYVSLALASIDHLYNSKEPRTPGNEAAAKAQVKLVLNGLTYGTDGYFFVYDFEGNNIIHPKQTWRVGKNWWGLEDSKGNLVIQSLIREAKKGGGFHRYLWDKPSARKIADKISYAVALDKWGWMLGTGIYIDDVVTQVQMFKADVKERVDDVFFLIMGIALVAVLIVSAAGIAINMHESSLADTKLKALTQRIVDTQEEERARVARELHDSISQILVSAKYSLELAETKLKASSSDAFVAIEKTVGRLNLAIQEVRRISRDLRPSMLDDLGLSTSLESLIKEFSNRTGTDIDVSTVASKNLLAKDAQTALYRIAQESLTNIERHATATKVQLVLTVDQKGVMLKISDNGRGFDSENIRKSRQPACGIGLKNMQERIEHFNGTLNVISSDTGTIIKAKLPKNIMLSKQQDNKAAV